MRLTFGGRLAVPARCRMTDLPEIDPSNSTSEPETLDDAAIRSTRWPATDRGVGRRVPAGRTTDQGPRQGAARKRRLVSGCHAWVGNRRPRRSADPRSPRRAKVPGAGSVANGPLGARAPASTAFAIDRSICGEPTLHRDAEPEQSRAGSRRRQRAAHDDARAVLRPRLRLRDHAGLASVARQPHWRGAGQAALILLVVWCSWNYTTW